MFDQYILLRHIKIGTKGDQNIYAKHKSLNSYVGWDTSRTINQKQMVFLGGHTLGLRLRSLIHKAVKQYQEIRSHGRQ